MKRLPRIFSAALAVAVLMVASFAPATVAAQSTNNKESSGLSITPKKNYVVEPGKSATDKLKITNLDRQSELVISLRVVDFTFTDESGTPKLLLDEKAEATPWSLKPFLKLPQTVKIPAGETRSVDMTVNVPKNQGAGSFYSAVVYSANGTNGGNVSLNASGVTLAFLSIPGIVNEKMSLQKLGAFQPDPSNTSGKYIFIATEKVPDAVAFTVKNDGNVAESPSGTIIIKNMFNQTVKELSNANPKNSLALIGQTRRFEACLNPQTKKIETENQIVNQETVCSPVKLWPGRYSIELTSFYGQNGNQTKELNGVATFWYLPWWFIAVVAAVLLIIVFIVWRIVRKLRDSGRPKGISLKRKR